MEDLGNYRALSSHVLYKVTQWGPSGGGGVHYKSSSASSDITCGVMKVSLHGFLCDIKVLSEDGINRYIFHTMYSANDFQFLVIFVIILRFLTL